MARFLSALAAIVLLCLPKGTSPNTAPAGPPPIDVVLLLDLSGSTGGILNSVRSKFWEIQNNMTRLSPTPRYRFSIVGMGRPTFKKENLYVKVIHDLTDDLDAVAWEFNQIKDVVSPGRYYLGDGLDAALNMVSWSTEPNAMKVIFCAGNGAASSGPGYQKAAKQAKEKGIIIHALYFEAYFNPTEQQEWADLAKQAGGKFFRIGLKEPNIHFEKPYSAELLLEACKMINNTYVYHGPDGLERFKRQSEIDRESELHGENAFEARAFFKSSNLYQGKNASWDIVDMINTGGNIAKLPKKYIDEELQKLPFPQLLLYFDEKRDERAEYISILKMLSSKREEHLRFQKQKLDQYRFSLTFFGVVNQQMVEMAEAKGYKFSF